MPDLPVRFAMPIITSAPLFVQRSWQHAQMLLSDAIWREQHLQTSPRSADRRKIPFRMPQASAYTLRNAA